MSNAVRLRRTTSTQHLHAVFETSAPFPETKWTNRLLPSERRHLRTAAWGFLAGLVTREEIKATIDATRLVALSREAAELRGGW